MKTINQNKLVNSVKTFINLLPINWTSSLEQPISKLYSESGLNKANGPIIYNILCNMGLSEKEGNVRGMRYKAGNIKNIDAQSLAEKAVETYYESLKEKRVYRKEIKPKKMIK